MSDIVNDQLPLHLPMANSVLQAPEFRSDATPLVRMSMATCESLSLHEPCSLKKTQVSWRAGSTGFSDPSLGKNYLEWLAESARLRMYSNLVVKDWEKAVDRQRGGVVMKIERDAAN